MRGRFRALADRYLGLVFHTALRRTNQRQLAEDISQNILCAMAQKASSLAKAPECLPAWLHRATLYESSKAMRAESSHQRRQILQAPATSVPDDSPWSDAIPHLDAALDQLPAADHRVVLLHFFENHSFPGLTLMLEAAILQDPKMAVTHFSNQLAQAKDTMHFQFVKAFTLWMQSDSGGATAWFDTMLSSGKLESGGLGCRDNEGCRNQMMADLAGVVIADLLSSAPELAMERFKTLAQDQQRNITNSYLQTSEGTVAESPATHQGESLARMKPSKRSGWGEVTMAWLVRITPIPDINVAIGRHRFRLPR